MGRKIPGRKHHGIRDPEKQAATRFNRIKDKINAPPLHPDSQEISKTLQRIINLKNKTKNGDFNKKKRKKHAEDNNNNKTININNTNHKGRYEKPIPVFEQRPNESDRAFVNRMNLICMNVKREAEFEEKYNVEVRRGADGKVEKVVKRPKDELEKIVNEIRKEKKKNKKKKSVEQEGPRLTKSQKWQKKKMEKLKKVKEKHSDFKGCENVTFGDIAHAPPTLVTPKKVQKQQIERRPGNKELLLKSMLSKNKDRILEQSTEKNTKKDANKVIDRKGKRRDLPHALRRQLDNQQSEIISAYKTLKAKKYSTA